MPAKSNNAGMNMGLMDQNKYLKDHDDNRDINMDELHELLGT